MGIFATGLVSEPLSCHMNLETFLRYIMRNIIPLSCKYAAILLMISFVVEWLLIKK
ncbi:hypothetical protein H206_01727 [Candidatus Electrothrix aarhusensis]|uniref:Uncharacterized protein n=1 Tax=Candidatus Electrothrix aarhusensis TaxID=1859131 RepID=A0A444IXV8_9BACT|nr:hypothetical protein H206_01727 [Candidatus Electrothrix aarhusensis]